MTAEASKEKHLPIDDITRKKLLYAKQFYLHGEQHARQQNPVDRMIAIHQFHIAIEIAIKAVFSKLFPKEKIGFMQFNTIVKKIRPKCPWLTDSRNEFLEKLNERRNDVQHAAEVLASEHMSEYQIKSEDILEDCLSQQFGVKFDELDVADAVSDERLRQVLVWAGELIYLEEHEYSIAFSKLVYGVASKYVRSRVDIFREVPGIHLSDTIGMDLEESVAYDDEELQAFKDSVYSGFRIILSGMKDIIVQLQTVGRAGGLHNYMSMTFLAPEIYSRKSGEIVFRGSDPEFEYVPHKDDAEKVRDYVMNCIIAWQETGLQPKWGKEDFKYFEWAEKQIEAKRKEASK